MWIPNWKFHEFIDTIQQWEKQHVHDGACFSSHTPVDAWDRCTMRRNSAALKFVKSTDEKTGNSLRTPHSHIRCVYLLKYHGQTSVLAATSWKGFLRTAIRTPVSRFKTLRNLADGSESIQAVKWVHEVQRGLDFPFFSEQALPYCGSSFYLSGERLGGGRRRTHDGHPQWVLSCVPHALIPQLARGP